MEQHNPGVSFVHRTFKDCKLIPSCTNSFSKFVPSFKATLWNYLHNTASLSIVCCETIWYYLNFCFAVTEVSYLIICKYLNTNFLHRNLSFFHLIYHQREVIDARHMHASTGTFATLTVKVLFSTHWTLRVPVHYIFLLSVIYICCTDEKIISKIKD